MSIPVSDLEIAIDLVSDLGEKLKSMKTDLKTSDGKKHYALDELGHRKVIDAMDNFHSNWNDNRDHLADKLGKLGELATQAAERFTEQDEQLAKEIREAMEGDQ